MRAQTLFSSSGAALAAAVLAISLPAVACPLPQNSPQVQSPVRIARDTRSGNLFVSDTQERRIRIFNAALQPVDSFPIDGKPLGVAVEGGVVLVGNANKGAVEFYRDNGEKIGQIAQVFLKPNDLALDVNGNKPVLFVCDTDARLVLAYPLRNGNSGVFPPQLPVGGPDPSILATPMAVALDPVAEEVYVSDFGDVVASVGPRIQVFSYDGTLKATIPGSASWFSRNFSRPQGLAVYGGRIFLVDSWLSKVLVYDRATLAKIGALGAYGMNPGQLSLPLDIVIDDKTTDVFVTNNLNRRVERFVGGAQ